MTEKNTKNKKGNLKGLAMTLPESRHPTRFQSHRLAVTGTNTNRQTTHSFTHIGRVAGEFYRRLTAGYGTGNRQKTGIPGLIYLIARRYGNRLLKRHQSGGIEIYRKETINHYQLNLHPHFLIKQTPAAAPKQQNRPAPLKISLEHSIFQLKTPGNIPLILNRFIKQNLSTGPTIIAPHRLNPMAPLKIAKEKTDRQTAKKKETEKTKTRKPASIPGTLPTSIGNIISRKYNAKYNAKYTEYNIVTPGIQPLVTQETLNTQGIPKDGNTFITGITVAPPGLPGPPTLYSPLPKIYRYPAALTTPDTGTPEGTGWERDIKNKTVKPGAETGRKTASQPNRLNITREELEPVNKKEKERPGESPGIPGMKPALFQEIITKKYEITAWFNRTTRGVHTGLSPKTDQYKYHRQNHRYPRASLPPHPLPTATGLTLRINKKAGPEPGWLTPVHFLIEKLSRIGSQNAVIPPRFPGEQEKTVIQRIKQKITAEKPPRTTGTVHLHPYKIPSTIGNINIKVYNMPNMPPRLIQTAGPGPAGQNKSSGINMFIQKRYHKGAVNTAFFTPAITAGHAL
ncbi:MAG: hypothetical protein GY757_56475, partial [bacterium]|nr:hypothetical protein [bacterium]